MFTSFLSVLFASFVCLIIPTFTFQGFLFFWLSHYHKVCLLVCPAGRFNQGRCIICFNYRRGVWLLAESPVPHTVVDSDSDLFALGQTRAAVAVDPRPQCCVAILSNTYVWREGKKKKYGQQTQRKTDGAGCRDIHETGLVLNRCRQES